MWGSEPGIYIFPLWQKQIVSLVTLGAMKFIIYYCFMDGEDERQRQLLGSGDQKREKESRSDMQRKIEVMHRERFLLALQFWFQQFVNLFFFF